MLFSHWRVSDSIPGDCEIHGGGNGLWSRLLPSFFSFPLLVIIPLLLHILHHPLRHVIALSRQHVTFSLLCSGLHLQSGAWLVVG
jgi:hypothetical protein